MKKEKGSCSCHHHKLAPIFVICIGGTFLLGALDVLNPHVVSIAWPSFVCLIGLQKLVGGMCQCCCES